MAYLSAEEFFVPIVISTGLFMYFLAIDEISEDMVAEKRSVLLPSGTSSRFH